MDNERQYDAILVLGGNLTKKADGSFAPTTYQDSDEYGMLGGYMRVIAAVWMYLAGDTNIFVFSTGTSEKTKAKYGSRVPTEAFAYSELFKTMLASLRPEHPEMESLDPPTIILEDISQNTVGNIRECFAIIREHGWANVGVMSAGFHIPRVKALCELLLPDDPIDANLTFISAEEEVKRLCPGKYDAEIDAAYASAEGQKRMKSEEQGLQAMRNGTYVMSEFQLHKN